ncbi:hypothetical protein ACFQ0M_48235 [Kitasatospora aburaviensis]|uniref:IrrE N-terminal-like domain-containing protein n=1 Tax=Kitasatospora aburaviensis TaxID=67265 RepID=A0ABW1EXE2_9ACTN
MPVPRRIRRECEELLAKLPIPDPFDIDAFIAALAAERGRPIALEPLPDDAGPEVPSGLWVRLPHGDVIFYKKNTSLPHQTLIILHELAHMIWEHKCRVEEDILKSIFPDLDDTLVSSLLLTRDGYDRIEEAQAEMMALLLAEALGADEGSTRQSRVLYRSLSFPVRKILSGWRRAA